MAGKGGFRAGAGRPPGRLSAQTIQYKKAVEEQRTKFLADGVDISELSPLEMMRYIMSVSMAEGNLNMALSAAVQLAPYISPKLSHQTITNASDPDKMDDAQLAELLQKLRDEKLAKKGAKPKDDDNVVPIRTGTDK